MRFPLTDEAPLELVGMLTAPQGPRQHPGTHSERCDSRSLTKLPWSLSGCRSPAGAASAPGYTLRTMRFPLTDEAPLELVGMLTAPQGPRQHPGTHSERCDSRSLTKLLWSLSGCRSPAGAASAPGYTLRTMRSPLTDEAPLELVGMLTARRGRVSTRVHTPNDAISAH